MFPFGSFLTQIPLILLAAVYMLYLGACTLNRTKTKEADNQPQSKEISVKDSAEKSTVKTFYFQNYQKEKGEALASTTRHFIPNDITFNRLYSLPDEDPSSTVFRFSLFSRPPPVIA